MLAVPTTAATIATNPLAVKGLKILLALGALVAGYFLIKKFILNKKQEDELNRAAVTDVTDSGIALQLKNELSNVFSNEEIIISLAAQICDVNKVRESYKLLTKGRELLTDLDNTLNTGEMARWNQNIEQGKNNACVKKDQNGKTIPNPAFRTVEYNFAIAKEYAKALDMESTWRNVDEDQLLQLSTKTYDFDGVAYQYQHYVKTYVRKGEIRNLKDDIDDAFDSWEADIRDKFWRNININKTR